MASYLILFFHLLLFLTSFIAVNGVFSEQFPIAMSTKRMEKMTRLHFYSHNTVNSLANNSGGGSGAALMPDDLLKEGPEASSKIVGRAQGIYGSATQHDIAYLILMNFAFTESIKYNGSSLSILGQNPVSDTEREMPIIGGSGLFRLARGYASAKTVEFNNKTLVAVVQYNVTVFHF